MCEYTEQSTSILHVDAQIAGWVQVRLPQRHWTQEWEGEGISVSSSAAKSRDESIITLLHQQADHSSSSVRVNHSVTPDFRSI